MKQYFFSLNKPYEQCIPLYEGRVRFAVLEAESGENVQIPAATLRRFIGHNGLKGRFRLVVDVNNKMKSFEKIA
ncbi:DUF2835 family protein [Aliiglaciecola sp. CAU 1673]|uniref:DUF2835 family protein n=1 Tax=Aliiglaciecola sp. CAU 1673 TaxID=3032595 RepID=UPI0023DC8401|nr:DUF2835 family protein [Aliiglaciecola sp. CAU 1673]MDF2177532.1 DUF2835 family protein [Aliiglaciecola sp. CAU 1673]